MSTSMNISDPRPPCHCVMTSYEISKRYIREQLTHPSLETYDSMLSRSKFRSLRLDELRHLERLVKVIAVEILTNSMHQSDAASQLQALQLGAGGAIGLAISALQNHHTHGTLTLFSCSLMSGAIIPCLSLVSTCNALYRWFKPQHKISLSTEKGQDLVRVSVQLKRELRAMIERKYIVYPSVTFPHRSARSKNLCFYRPVPWSSSSEESLDLTQHRESN